MTAKEIAMAKQTPVSAHRRRLLGMLGLLAAGPLVPLGRAFAGDDMADMPMTMPMAGHEHHHHDMAAMADKPLKRSEASYAIPEVTLVRRDGTNVAFPDALDDGKPVLLNFIYTSCTAICPLTSQVFSQVEHKLDSERDRVTMISISIDPEYDTPARLRSYAKRFNAGNDWQYYTGSVEASLAMQKAFDVYRGDKMNHFPVTFLRPAPGKAWLRLEGFASADELVQAYHQVIKGS
jgi:protein SCO1